MEKQPVGQLPDLTQSNNDDEIMVITNSEYNQLKKEKISDFITDLTSTDENNAIVKGTDGKLFTKDFGNASNITEGTLPTSVLPEIPLEKIPDIPKDKLPQIETADLPVSGVTADTYVYPSSVTVNAQGQVTGIVEGAPGANNANQDLSNLSPEGEKHFLNKTQITNCILEAPNGVVEWSGVTPTGSLVNNQGVVSGFSADSYGVINKEIPQNITSLEMYATATLNELNTHSFIFAQLNANRTTPQMGIATNNNFVCDISPDGTSWVSLLFAPNELTPETGQTYNWLATWDIESKILTFKVKKAQDETFTLSKTATLNAINWTDLMTIGMDEIDTGEYFRGSIDLSQSYIKINGEMWWQGNDLGFNQFRVKQGLKTLIPNGRNEDRTLKNIENTVTQDSIQTIPTGYTNRYWAAVGENATRLAKYAWEYNEDKNYITGIDATTIGQKSLTTMIGDMEVKNGNIVSFTPYNPVSLATKDEIEDIKNDVEDIKKEYGTAYIIETYNNGYSWYRIWSDNWCEQGGRSAELQRGRSVEVSLIKPYKDTNYTTTLGSSTNARVNNDDSVWLPLAYYTNSAFTVYCSEGGNNDSTINAYIQWNTKGYIA